MRNNKQLMIIYKNKLLKNSPENYDICMFNLKAVFKRKGGSFLYNLFIKIRN